MKVTIGFFSSFILLAKTAFSQTASIKSVPDQFMTINTREILAHPEILQTIWTNTPLPLSSYSQNEKIVQQHINELSEEIVTYNTSDKEELTEVDFEPITPFTWKWIDLELINVDYTKSQFSLRRSNLWIEKIGATHIGNKIYIGMPEMGIDGFATVVNIRVNQLDTRLWNEEPKGNYVKRPITGKFEHESSDVYELQFDDQPQLLGVTGEHPFWSVDRDRWIGAKFLRIGENLKTRNGIIKLTSRTKKQGRYRVYNLEVFKDHTYFVSTKKALVHNSCIGTRTVGEIVNLTDIHPGQPYVGAEFVEDVSEKMEVMLGKTGKIDWEVLRKGSAPHDQGKIRVCVYSDGTKVLHNGHHRVVAAELTGVEIPWDDPNVVETLHFDYSIPTVNDIKYEWNEMVWKED